MTNLYSDQEPEENSFDLIDLISPYLRQWKYYIICVTLGIIAAVFYLKNVTPIYQVSTSFLLKDEAKGGGSIGALADFENLGLFEGGGSKVDNELELLKSKYLIENTIKVLKTNIEYWKIDGLKKLAFYKNNPFSFKSLNFSFDDLKEPLEFEITIKGNKEFEITFEDSDEMKVFSWGSTISYDNLNFILIPQVGLLEKEEGSKFLVSIEPMDLVIESLQKKISFSASAKKNDVIKLSLKDASKERARDILNTLVELYNNNAVEDKKEINVKTRDFIVERLSIIKAELIDIEEDAERFKEENRLLNLESQSTLFSESISKSKEKLNEIATQTQLANFISENLIDKSEEFSMIPINLGLNNSGLERLSLAYNDIIIERDRIKNSTNDLNPVIKALNSQLRDLKINIQSSLDNYKQTLKVTEQELLSQERLLNSRIAAIPIKERQYRSIARQQELKEALYLFLLQKQEETALSIAATASNSKIIDLAYGSRKPVAPQGKIILLVGLLLGFILPTGVIYVLDLLDTKIHNKKELEDLLKGVPVLGDIPTGKDKNNRISTTSDRTSTAEAFRILRTNVKFLMNGGSDGCQTMCICITSTIGGEGKTYISVNMATVLSFSKKKVLLLGCDVRNPKMAEYFEQSQQHLGLTNYLSDKNMNLEDVIVPQNDNPHLDVIFSGIIPPNPVELLSSERYKNMMVELKANYDFIVIDTAPVSLVTDTLLISKYADMFIYVTRAEYLDKRMLEIPRNLYKEKRLPNMAMVLNDIDVKKGYGYGYGYGYGETDAKKKWYEVFKS